MTLRKTGLALGVAMIGLMVVAAPQAQQLAETNNKTILTFDQPVEVPGMVLPAGSYTFQLMDSPSTDRHIVQIFDKDGSKLITTVMAMNESRTDPADKTVTAFYEVPAGKPQALRVWFYPGKTTGQGFIYPKTRATELEASGNATVNSAEDAELQAQIQAQTPKQTSQPTEPVVQSTTTPTQQQTTTTQQQTTTTPPTPVVQSTTTPTQQQTTTTQPQTTQPQTPVVQSTTTPTQQQTTTTQPQTPANPTMTPANPTSPTEPTTMQRRTPTQPTEPNTAASPTTNRDELPHTASSAPTAMLMGILAMAMGAALSRVGRKQNV